ncbi:MAG: cytochrome b N-terminal domain-containing protein [Planctomycetes bacterium]|nr:cytochrome b N-terminal domain-containing protein [Planctomycetota bacterium]
MTRLLLEWLDSRTGYRSLMHEALYERVPGGARWRYVWGSTLVFTFVTQLITGLFLWMSYSPSSQTAWESVYYIQHEMQLGWMLRGIHHFTAQAMVVLLVIHLLQVIIDGAYKAPREVNFWLGLILMKIVLGLSLTGYLLPWDQKGYWATKVATNIAGITPVVGEQVQTLAVGGPNYGHHTLTRFFALHAGLLPALLIGFLALHMYVFRRHGLTVPDPIHKPDSTFWPDQVLKDGVACLAVLATVLFLVMYHGVGPHGGAELGAPADATENYSAARPEWYFLFLFQMLKYFPGESEVIGAMLIPGVILTILALMPILGRWKLGHSFNVAFMGGIILGVVILTGLAIREDSGNTDYRWAVADAETKAERVKELAELQGIGPAGAVQLLRDDPKTRGAALFAAKCASCHRYAGHDGVGRVSAEPATAADLATFGTREWIHSILTDPAGEKNFGATARVPEVGERFTKGEMAQWVAECVTSGKLTAAELNTIVEFLASLSEHKLRGPVDQTLVSAGQKLFAEGKDGVTACYDCHAMKVSPDPEGLFEGSSAQIATGAPDLTGYGSAAWLRDFLINPGDKRFYGSHNAMPGFGGQLSDVELKLIVDFLLHNWLEKPPAAGGAAGSTH